MTILYTSRTCSRKVLVELCARELRQVSHHEVNDSAVPVLPAVEMSWLNCALGNCDR